MAKRMRTKLREIKEKLTLTSPRNRGKSNVPFNVKRSGCEFSF